eukprot:5697881-Amphidinium_carterae.1
MDNTQQLERRKERRKLLQIGGAFCLSGVVKIDCPRLLHHSFVGCCGFHRLPAEERSRPSPLHQREEFQVLVRACLNLDSRRMKYLRRKEATTLQIGSWQMSRQNMCKNIMLKGPDEDDLMLAITGSSLWQSFLCGHLQSIPLVPSGPW